MKKSVLLLIIAILFSVSCAEELDYGKNQGTISINIANEKPEFRTGVNTRSITSDQGVTTWCTGDEVDITINFFDRNGGQLTDLTKSQRYVFVDDSWVVENDGNGTFLLSSDIRSIRIEARMRHEYPATGQTGGIDIRGTETMVAVKEFGNIVPTNSYKVDIDTWTRTSAVIQSRNATDNSEVSIYKADTPHQNVLKVAGNGVFHLEEGITYMLRYKLATDSGSKSYTINSLTAGKWYIYNLAERPAVNPFFDPYSGLPIIPDYPGYIKYTKSDTDDAETEDGVEHPGTNLQPGITYYAVANGEGLNAALIDADNSNNGANTMLTLYDDVDMSNVKYIPVGDDEGYKGCIDGNGHTVSGLSMSTIVLTDNIWLENKGENPEDPEDAQYECAGLIGYLDEGGVIKNITMNDVNINIVGSVYNADLHIGAIASICAGRIENCHVRGNVVMTATPHQDVITSYNNGIGKGYGYDGRIGAITSTLYDTGQVVGCSLEGTFKAESSYNKFTIIGGLVGFVIGKGGEIVACYTDGNINIYTLVNTFYDHFTANIGGLIGIRESVDTDNLFIGCYTNLDDESILKLSSAAKPIIEDYYGGIGGLMVPGDTYNAVYWKSSPNVDKGYVGLDNAILDGIIRLDAPVDWGAVVTAMNEAIDAYVARGGDCVWRYKERSGGSPILYNPSN